MPIRHLAGLCEMIGTHHNTIGAVSKAIFKGTNCGAWVATTGDAIQVGSTVEGADEGTEVHDLTYPFSKDDFWKAVQAVEDEAESIWKNTHGCEKCWPEGTCDEWGNEWSPGEVGAKPTDPNCPECKGEGIVL